MNNESMAQDSSSESSSNKIASDRDMSTACMPRAAAAWRMIRSWKRKARNAGNVILTPELKNENSKHEELFFHLMSFWVVASDETFTYLKVLSFSGREAADKKATEEGWEIDHEIVEMYRAGMRAIVAKYEHTTLAESLTRSVKLLFGSKGLFRRLMDQSRCAGLCLINRNSASFASKIILTA